MLYCSVRLQPACRSLVAYKYEGYLTELKIKEDTPATALNTVPPRNFTCHGQQTVYLLSVTGLQHFAYIMLVKLISDGSDQL